MQLLPMVMEIIIRQNTKYGVQTEYYHLDRAYSVPSDFTTKVNLQYQYRE